MEIKEGAVAVAAAAPAAAPKPKLTGNYSTIAKELFHHYNRLAEDPDQW
jgi:hypothetical protein